MKSSLPKVLHSLAGRPMISHVLAAASQAGLQKRIVVLGTNSGAFLPAIGDAQVVTQAEQLGTAHAVTQARELLSGAEQIVVLNGDVPLVRSGTLLRLMEEHERRSGDVTFLTAHVKEAEEYGCVERDASGQVIGVVEAPERAASQEGPAEMNSGQYCFRASWLWSRLDTVPKAANGEQYLTSIIGMAAREGAVVTALPVEDADEVRGINTRVQLADAEAAVRRRINNAHMLAGVTIADPERTYIDISVSIGADSRIEPNTHLKGETRVGSACLIGPDTTLRDAEAGASCQIVSSTIEESVLEDSVDVGPYSHIRPGAHLASGVHIGNYVEIKNARLERGVKVGHFSYIGDAEVGEGTNIGAGTITANYDGERKNKTKIGRDAFIGSDTVLVAPVVVGDGARTGAGSVVTKDVAPGAVAVGAPARILRRNQEGQ
jgi:bifunctional UDP-N-acetylglucosamine pyrophosphorylase/glucosamine-1-phosphate N-acetyltransferase